MPISTVASTEDKSAAALSLEKSSSSPPPPNLEMSKTDSDDTSVKIDVVVEKKPTAEEKLPPVSFTQLFQFSTRLEIALDFLGVAAALLAGAAQVEYPLLSNKLWSCLSTGCRSDESVNRISLSFHFSLGASPPHLSASELMVSLFHWLSPTVWLTISLHMNSPDHQGWQCNARTS